MKNESLGIISFITAIIFVLVVIVPFFATVPRNTDSLYLPLLSIAFLLGIISFFRIKKRGDYYRGYTILYITFVIIFVVSGSFVLYIKNSSYDSFLCSDYCPGGMAKYTKKVYPGISDEYLCRVIGGTPHEFYGWGRYKNCLVK